MLESMGSPRVEHDLVTELQRYLCLLFSLVDQMVKHLPTMRETQVQSLGQEDLLEKEMATHSSTLCLENPMDGEAW